MQTLRRSLIILLLAVCGGLLSAPAMADPYVDISDRGGTHLGYCHDTALWELNPTLNYGVNTTNSVGDFVGDLVIILRFDLSIVPPGSRFTIAAMILQCTAVGGGGQTVSVFQIDDANNDWAEGTKTGEAEAGSPCWNDHSYNSVQEWLGGAGGNTAGTDYINTSLASVACTTTGAKTFTFNASGIAAIQARLDAGEGDIELILIPGNYNANVYSQFAMSEHATTAYRPALQVHFRTSFVIGNSIGM